MVLAFKFSFQKFFYVLAIDEFYKFFNGSKNKKKKRKN